MRAFACVCDGAGFAHDTNLIDFNEDNQEYFKSEPSETDPVEDIKAHLACLRKDAKAKLANEMGVTKDFPLA